MTGFWMGHRMLGDVLGFCAAAHLYSLKIAHSIIVSFDSNYLDACNYFDGVIWVPGEVIPDAIDCSADPTAAEWPSLNGVKRFYRFMDPTLQSLKSFDIHFNRSRPALDTPGEKRIGLITHSHTHGEIDSETLHEMLEEARCVYPNHRIGCIGNSDSTTVPSEVEDWRQSDPNISWIIESVARLDLLISPLSDHCFIAAGWGVPMWVYRSREAFRDWPLTYDSYRVERWWDRKPTNAFAVFDDIYRQGGWNGLGSGPGSAVEVNSEYIQFLNDLIHCTPSIRTILDIGCGDWQIMRHVDLSGKQYLGIDVVPSIIESNSRNFGTDAVSFQVLNPCVAEIPCADLILMKDVLQHLPDPFVKQILDQVIKRCRFAVISNDWTERNESHEIRIGEWRPVNVLLSPHRLRGCTIGIWNGKHFTLSSFHDTEQSSAPSFRNPSTGNSLSE